MRKRVSKVNAITVRISRSLLGLRRDLVALGRVIQSVVGADHGGAGARGGAKVRRRRRKLTPADRARLRIQGEYLGLVRHLSTRNRAKVKTLRSKKGYSPAIKMARRLVKGA